MLSMTKPNPEANPYTPILQAISRRQRRGRIAGRLLWPVMLLTVAGSAVRWWLALPGILALICLQVIGFIAACQVCPICRTGLIVRRRFSKEFATTCPGCGFPID